MTTKLLPVTVLISGGGTTLKNLLDRKERGELPVEFRLVISSNPTAKGLAYAEQAGIATRVIRRKQFSNGEDQIGRAHV